MTVPKVYDEWHAGQVDAGHTNDAGRPLTPDEYKEKFKANASTMVDDPGPADYKLAFEQAQNTLSASFLSGPSPYPGAGYLPGYNMPQPLNHIAMTGTSTSPAKGHFSPAYAQQYRYPYASGISYPGPTVTLGKPSFLSKIAGGIRNIFGKFKKKTPQLGMAPMYPPGPLAGPLPGYGMAGIATPAHISQPTILYDIPADADPDLAVSSADAILEMEMSLRKQEPFRATIAKRLEELRYDKKWLSLQPDSEQAKLELEKKIRKLKRTCLESTLEHLLGGAEKNPNDISINQMQNLAVY